VIACVARLHPKKGQWVLLDALAQLVADGVDASVLLVGDARPEHAELEQRLHEQVVAAGLTDRVVFVGYQPDPTPWYAEADVAVVPSVFPEEFSLVAAEAQALGLPVVATGPGGVSEVVLHETTGLIVPAGDPDALARALARLAGEPELARRFGSAGAVRSRELFGIDAYRERLGAAVDSVLDGGT
jgi:glycosyltransferase involved in cell wall biosynthesis